MLGLFSGTSKKDQQLDKQEQSIDGLFVSVPPGCYSWTLHHMLLSQCFHLRTVVEAVVTNVKHTPEQWDSIAMFNWS